MMRQGRKWLLMAMLFVAFNAMAESVWVDDVCYDLIPDNNTAKVSTGLFASGDVVIPRVVTHEGVDYVVVSVEDNAFMGRNITSVVLPESVRRIGSYAFAQCRSLSSVALPKGGVDIRSYAFANCSSLNSIVFPEGEVTVGERAFIYCSGLVSVTVSENVNLTTLGDVFYECDKLERVEIYCENVDDWFWSNEAIKEVVLGEQVVTIGEAAFWRCANLTTVVIPDNSRLTTIGAEAFYNCENLAAIAIPKGVTSVGDRAFYDCEGLERVTINCANVGRWFNGNATIKEIVLGEGVEALDHSAFYDCAGLTSIVIPRGVKSIGGSVFFGCSSLASIVVDGGNQVYDSRGGCNAIVETASNTLLVGCSATVVPEDILGIGSYAFAGCVDLSSIVLPEGVTTIEHSAFYDCSNLVSISIPASVTSIGGIAFSGCTGLTSITSHAAVPPTCEMNAFSGVNTTIPVYVPLTSVAAYQSANEWGLFTNYVGVDTGINNPIVEVQNQGLVYDLHGRRIADSANFKGVCLVNGKKVLLK